MAKVLRDDQNGAIVIFNGRWDGLIYLSHGWISKSNCQRKSKLLPMSLMVYHVTLTWLAGIWNLEIRMKGLQSHEALLPMTERSHVPGRVGDTGSSLDKCMDYQTTHMLFS